RPPLIDQRVFPTIESGTMKTWIGVGGSPQSVVRAAHYDLPLMLAIIGGDPNRFRPMSISTIGPSHNLAGRFVKSNMAVCPSTAGYFLMRKIKHFRANIRPALLLTSSLYWVIPQQTVQKKAFTPPPPFPAALFC